MRDKTLTDSVATVPSGVGDAVGVTGRRRWYVAVVGNNTERQCGERLASLGYDSYVASQEEYRVWKNGRRGKVERILIPSVVFVRCSEAERRRIVSLPYINRFMSNRAGGRAGVPAVVSEREIGILRFMLGQSDIPVFIGREYRRGDRVRVVRGPLRGLEGEIQSVSDVATGAEAEASVLRELIVRLDYLGCASVHISRRDVEFAPTI